MESGVASKRLSGRGDAVWEGDVRVAGETQNWRVSK